VMPMALANNKLPSVLQYINITYEVINSENEVCALTYCPPLCGPMQRVPAA
jgi:hypothetical protein